jgi:hypothetical protein
MSKPARIIAGLVVLALGYSLGSCGNDVETVTKTETKIIRVPEVVTHVEYKDKAVPLPEACYTAAEVLPRISEGDATQTAAVGEILLALQDMGRAAAMNDVHEVNRLTEVVREEGYKLNTSVLDRNQAMSTFNSYLKQCEAAMPPKE